jgi:hypothetical protein
MHVISRSRISIILVVIGIYLIGYAARAQNLTVHGTLTDLQSAYSATQGGNVGIGLANHFVNLHVWSNSPTNVIAGVENASTLGSARGCRELEYAVLEFSPGHDLGQKAAYREELAQRTAPRECRDARSLR